MKKEIMDILLPIALIAIIFFTLVILFIFLPKCYPCLECHEKNMMCYCPDGKFPQENQPYCENKSNVKINITPDFRGNTSLCETETILATHDYGQRGGIQIINCYRCKGMGGDWYCPV